MCFGHFYFEKNTRKILDSTNRNVVREMTPLLRLFAEEKHKHSRDIETHKQ